MTSLLPGANERSMRTWGMGPIGLWEAGEGNAVHQWNDGTIWVLREELYTYNGGTYDWLDEGVGIFELVPGAIGWERINGDDYAYPIEEETSEAGHLANHWIQERDTMTLCDGDDTMYMAGTGVLQGAWFEIKKSTRTWKRIAGYRRPTPVGGLYFDTGLVDSGNGLDAWLGIDSFDNTPWLNDGYVWWWQADTRAGQPSNADESQVLRRMSTSSPYGVETVKTFKNTLTSYEKFDINSSTGLPKGLDPDTQQIGNIGGGDGNEQSIIVDGWLYVLEVNTQVSSDAVYGFPGDTAYAALRRIEVDGGTTFENIIIYTANTEFVPYFTDEPYDGHLGTYSYNYPDGTRNTKVGPFPKYVGMGVGQFTHLGYKDGWLYYTDRASVARYAQYDWYTGQNWQRLNLDWLLAEKDKWPLVHDPTNPYFEILSNASSPLRSHSRWFGTVDKISWWKDGDRPVHGIPENGWSLVGNGSIMFAHVERGELYHSWDNGYPLMLSTLDAPSNSVYDVSLVFEGQSLMGYSAVASAHQQTQAIEVNLV